MSSLPKTYASLRSELRHQETKAEITLAELSSLTNSAPSQEDIHIEDRLHELFAQRRETIDAMAQLLDSDPSGGGARVHQVARAREILSEHEKEFRRMKVPVYLKSSNRIVSDTADEGPRGPDKKFESSPIGSTDFR